jgi:hypothetical protein
VVKDNKRLAEKNKTMASINSMLAKLAMVAFVCVEGPPAVLGPKNGGLGIEQ